MQINHPTTDASRLIVKEFTSHLKEIVNEKKGGIWPALMMVQAGPGGMIDVTRLNMPEYRILDVFVRACQHSSVEAAMVGLDRIGDPQEMKTEFQDLQTCFLYEKVPPFQEETRVRDQFKFGIVEYHITPRGWKPINWENKFWITYMENEVFQLIPDLIIGADGSRRPGPSMVKGGVRAF